MAEIRSFHPARVALVTVAVLAAFALSPRPASATGLLGDLTGQVEEVTAPVTQAVQPTTVQGVGAAVTTTVEKVTTAVTPPAHATATKGADPSTTAGKGGGLADQAAKAVAGAGSLVGAATGAAEETVQATLPEDIGNPARSALPTSPTVSTDPEPTDPSTAAPSASSTEPQEGAGDAAAAEPPPDASTYVPPPAQNGSTVSPLPRWIAYVWPAVALTGPYVTDFGERWGRAIERLAAAATSGPTGEGGVAGVHASGGDPAEASSTPLFARLPIEAAHAFSSVPTPALVYLGLLILAVIAVALGVRHEILVGRRHSRF